MSRSSRLIRWIRAACLALAALSLAAPVAAQYSHNVEPLRAAFGQANARRIGVTPIGDSNTNWGNSALQGGYGYLLGLQRELDRLYGLYALGPFPAGAISNGYGLAHGVDIVQWFATTGITLNSGAPSELHQYAPPANLYGGTSQHGTPQGYYSIANGNFLAAGQSNPVAAGIAFRGTRFVVDSCLLPLSEGFKVHWTDGTFPSGTAGVRYYPNVATDGLWPSASNGGVRSILAIHEGVTTVTGSYGLEDFELTVPAGNYANRTLYFCYGLLQEGAALPVSTAWNGPAFNLWQMVEDHNQATGCHVGLWLWQSGLTSAHAKNHLTDASGTLASAGYDVDAAYKEWIRQMTRLQGGPGPPILIVPFFHCTNDTVAAITPAQTAANAAAVLAQLRTWWSELGYDEENLYFVPTVYQNCPGVTHTPAVRQAIYEALVAEFDGDDRVTVLWLGHYSPDDLTANGWLDANAAHASYPTGFDGMSAVMMREILGSRYSVYGGVIR